MYDSVIHFFAIYQDDKFQFENCNKNVYDEIFNLRTVYVITLLVFCAKWQDAFSSLSYICIK